MAHATVKKRSPERVIMIVVSTYLYAITNELYICWTSPVLTLLKSNKTDNPIGRTITTNEQEWLASFICIGCMAGLIPYCYMCSKYGRKNNLLSLGLIHTIATYLFFTSSLTCYYTGRFLNGAAYSVGLIIFPMYLAEICKDSDRGRLLFSRQIFTAVGTLLAYMFGEYFKMFPLNAIMGIFPILFVVTFAAIGIESPYYYVISKRYDEAKTVYIKMNLKEGERIEVDEEILEMKMTVEISETESLKDLLKQRHVQKSIFLVFALFVFQQLTGYMAFATYTEVIAGSKKPIAFIGFAMLIGSAFTSCFIDILGRKFHLLLSGAGVVLVQLALVLYYAFSLSNFNLLVVCITLFFLSYNLGLALIPQIICAEILPQRIKFEVAAMAGLFGWGVAFFITNYYLEVHHVWMISGFLVCSIIQLIIILKFVPETKRQSFRMIQGMLQIDANPIEE